VCPYLLRHYRQHFKVDAVELVKTRPSPRGRQPFEELALQEDNNAF
jgi:hypothetical protein